MTNDIRVGKSKDHTKRKNPRAHELWMKEKRANRGSNRASVKTHSGEPFGQTGSWGSGYITRN